MNGNINPSARSLPPAFPNLPFSSGFRLFTVEMMSLLTDVPSTERMSVIPKKWKELSVEDKQKYNDLAKKVRTFFCFPSLYIYSK